MSDSEIERTVRFSAGDSATSVSYADALSDSELISIDKKDPNFSSPSSGTSELQSRTDWDWKWGDLPHKDPEAPPLLPPPVTEAASSFYMSVSSASDGQQMSELSMRQVMQEVALVSTNSPNNAPRSPSFDSSSGTSAQLQPQAPSTPNSSDSKAAPSTISSPAVVRPKFFIEYILNEKYFIEAMGGFASHIQMIVLQNLLMSDCAMVGVPLEKSLDSVFTEHQRSVPSSPLQEAGASLNLCQAIFSDKYLIVKFGDCYLPGYIALNFITNWMFTRSVPTDDQIRKTLAEVRKDYDAIIGPPLSPTPQNAGIGSRIKRWWYKSKPNYSDAFSDSECDAHGQRSPSPAASLAASVVGITGSRLGGEKTFVKSLRLTSIQLKLLKLIPGHNSVKFSLASNPAIFCQAKIFLWDHTVKVVISDIDGTITKSDVFGHIFTLVGKDWTHAGVANLYSLIKKNGYEFLYLTARALGQATSTREYLKNVEQNRIQLPDGPVIMSPDRLFAAFHREVIMKSPEAFKITALKDIQRLFKGKNPFVAGFGNRITDAISYKGVEIPATRIFLINPVGNVSVNNLSVLFTTSYSKMAAIVDNLFPPVRPFSHEDSSEFFNEFNYWKAPIAKISVGAPSSLSKLSLSTQSLEDEMSFFSLSEKTESADTYSEGENDNEEPFI